jgi:hypothetical protein
MMQGKTLQAMAAELDRQRSTRKDYIAPQSEIHTEVLDGEVVLDGLNGDAYRIKDHAHGQLATFLQIPQKYYDRMLAEDPDLLTKNVNAWMAKNGGERRMVRTLDGQVRAFLSPKYRPLDNFELAEVLLPKLVDLGVQVMSAELTETRMYIKAILPSLSDDLPVGAIWGSGHTQIAEYGANRAGRLVSAIVVSNSEVGAGSLRVEPSVFTTWCTNLAIMAQAALRKYHVGRSLDSADDMSIYRDETRAADDKAFFLKVRDVAGAAFDPAIFQAGIEQIRLAAARKIDPTADLVAVVDRTIKTLALPERSSTGILSMLAQGGDLSQWGIASAITAKANDSDDYELATALERAGGTILALPDRQWADISTAKLA